MKLLLSSVYLKMNSRRFRVGLKTYNGMGSMIFFKLFSDGLIARKNRWHRPAFEARESHCSTHFPYIYPERFSPHVPLGV